MASIICCGEGMLELTRQGSGCQLGYGGDTLNTAIHLARAGHAVGYLTALGTDPFSAELREEWAGEGIDCRFVLAHPRRLPGLYAITLDDAGERTFAYWRDSSAAREMFALPEMAALVPVAAAADLLIFSLISLAILPDEGRQALLDLARRVRANGGRVGFDANYRSRLWSSPEEARAWRDRAIALADFGLPTLDDERLLGDVDAALVAAHWRELGCGEVVVKLGDQGCLLPDGTIAPPPAVLVPLDTSGAGDAFNAGYLGARMNGETECAAAAMGQALAGWTIMRRGAVPRRLP